jgi:hypothetical protein
MTTRTGRVGRSLQSLTTSATFAASGFNEVIELSYLLSQSVGLDPGDKYQPLVIIDSVGDGMCTETGPPRFAQIWTSLTCSLRQATMCQS